MKVNGFMVGLMEKEKRLIRIVIFTQEL
jgi:hypothetical protein